jgi:hypothetical protein
VSKSADSPTEVLTNKDVVSMLNAGLTEEIVSTQTLFSTRRDEFLNFSNSTLANSTHLRSGALTLLQDGRVRTPTPIPLCALLIESE